MTKSESIIEATDKYFEDAYAVFHDYFTSRENFENQYNHISSRDQRKNFLRLASSYRVLVKDGKFNVPDNLLVPPSGENYFDTTYKYIALSSIIEAIYSKKEHLDFYEWLCKQKKLPICETEELNELYRKYKSEYGATDKFRSFFEDNLKQEEIEFLQSHIEILNRSGKCKNNPIKRIANILYGIRSKFVHECELSIYFHGSVLDMTPLTNKKKKEAYSVSLRWDQLLKIFEIAFLRYYEFDWDRRIDLR